MVLLAALAVLAALRLSTPAAGAADSAVSQPAVSQDYRAGLFALQTGRMTFGQLWFSASR
jgi:hypothetical protein